MHTLIFKPVGTTVFVLSALCAATDAAAVHISPTGAGQVLLFPYYTVRNGFNTLLTVTNTQNNTKVVKVRFREGLNGRAVHDFNLFLSPNDSWAGAVVETAGGARLVTNDNSCVSPAELFAEIRTNTLGQALNEFWNFSYSGGFADATSLASLDRTREGYFEVIEMGVIDPALSATAAQLAGYVQQNAAGVPANCAALNNFDGFVGNPNPVQLPNRGAALMAPPRGGLKGRASLISAANGANYSYGPTALEAWSAQVAYSPAGDSAAGSILSAASPSVSMVTTPAGVVTARWITGQDAVSAALMRESVINEYVLDSGTDSQTDWVIAFPTKTFYTSAGSTQAAAPFSSGFSLSGTGSCDGYDYAGANREGSDVPFDGSVFPLLPPETVTRSELCWAATVVPFKSGVFGPSPADALLGSRANSRLHYLLQDLVNKSTTQPGANTTPALRGARQGPNGKVTMRFSRPQQQLTPISATLISPTGAQTSILGRHYGLPMIGVMLQNYRNANVASRYGGLVEHSYTVRIE